MLCWRCSASNFRSSFASIDVVRSSRSFRLMAAACSSSCATLALVQTDSEPDPPCLHAASKRSSARCCAATAQGQNVKSALKAACPLLAGADIDRTRWPSSLLFICEWPSGSAKPSTELFRGRIFAGGNGGVTRISEPVAQGAWAFPARFGRKSRNRVGIGICRKGHAEIGTGRKGVVARRYRPISALSR